MDPAVAFGKVLRSLRLGAELTQEELSLEAGVERNFVSLIERGINQPTVRVIFKLAAALDIKTSEMMALVERELSEFP